MLPYEDFERWVRQLNLSEQPDKEVLYSLVNNLWMLARQLEKKAEMKAEEAKIEELSITATGE